MPTISNILSKPGSYWIGQCHYFSSSTAHWMIYSCIFFGISSVNSSSTSPLHYSASFSTVKRRGLLRDGLSRNFDGWSINFRTLPPAPKARKTMWHWCSMRFQPCIRQKGNRWCRTERKQDGAAAVLMVQALLLEKPVRLYESPFAALSW